MCYSKCLAMALLILSLTACMSSNNTFVKSNSLDENIEPVSYLNDKAFIINDTYVAVGTDSHQLQGFSEGGYINQFGLVGMLTQAFVLNGSNSTTQKQQKSLQPLLNSIIEYNYSSKLRSEIESELTEMEWLNVNYVGKHPGLQKNNADQLLDTNDEDNLVIVDSSYSFSEEFDTLNINCFVVMHLKQRMSKDNVSPKSTLIYKNTFNYTYDLTKAGQGKVSALNIWSENDGEILTQVFDAALKELSKNISNDMNLKKHQEAI